MRLQHLFRHLSRCPRIILFAALLALFAYGPGLWSTLAGSPSRQTTSTVTANAGTPRVSVHGTIVAVDPSLLGVAQTGATNAVGFPLTAETTLIRAGELVETTSLRPGDVVELILDRPTGRLLVLRATPATPPFPVPSAPIALLAAVGWLAGAFTLVSRNRNGAWQMHLAAFTHCSWPRLLGRGLGGVLPAVGQLPLSDATPSA
jgi:hypothetical protein